MDSFSVEILESAEKDFRAVPFPFRKSMNEAIQKLKSEPRPANCTKIGEGEAFRLIVHGWVVVYGVDDTERVVTIFGIRAASTG